MADKLPDLNTSIGDFLDSLDSLGVDYLRPQFEKLLVAAGLTKEDEPDPTFDDADLDDDLI